MTEWEGPRAGSTELYPPGVAFIRGFRSGNDRKRLFSDRHPGLERDLQHLFDVAGEEEDHLAPDRLRLVGEGGFVALRHDHFLEAGAVRGQALLLDAADRQHLALEGDLARHADRVADR